MTAYAFDTLKAADELIAAGIDSKHARAITAAMRGAVTEGVATKADVANLESRPMTEISTIRWALGFIAAVVLLMAGRMFGAL